MYGEPNDMAVIEIRSGFSLLEPVQVAQFKPKIVHGHVLNAGTVPILIENILDNFFSNI